jgi:hypothetical protein
MEDVTESVADALQYISYFHQMGYNQQIKIGRRHRTL